MYPNNNIQAFTDCFAEIKLTNLLSQDYFMNPFYSHLEELNKHYILGTASPKELSFNNQIYNSLSQFAIEKVEFNNEVKIDWGFIDNALEIATHYLNKQLGNEANSEVLKPFKQTTLEAIENYLIYSYSGKDKYSNPFFALSDILKNGCLHLVSDNLDLIRDLYPKVVENKKDNTDNFGILAASKKYNKSKHKNSFSGFFIDKRINNQSFVYKMLLLEAKGRSNALSTENILQKMIASNRSIDENSLKAKVLFPLKRQGLIGSNNQGYFYIDTFDDFKETYLYHHDIIEGIKRTQQQIIEKAELKGYIGFEEIMVEEIKKRG